MTPAAVPPPELPTSSAAAKGWRAGTLTYTSAGLVTLFCWLLLGDFAWAMRDRSVGPTAQWYLSHLKVPNLLFGLLIGSFPALIGLVLTPIVSVKSDHHRGRFGRRIPFLLVMTPLAALGMVGLALTPLLARELHHALAAPATIDGVRALLGDGRLTGLLQSEKAAAVLCFGLFWALFECASITSQNVFAGLINDVVPVSLLGRFYGLFRMVSLVDGMLFNYWIIGKVPSHYTLILLVLGTCYGAAFLWVCFKVKEGIYPPPETRAQAEISNSPISATPPRRFTAAIRSYFRESFTHPYYLALFLMLTTAGLCFTPVNTFSIPYARSLGVGMDLYGRTMVLTFTISLALSFPLGWLADRFHPLRVGMVVLAGYAAVALWGSRYATTAHAFLVGWLLHGVLSGCYYTCAASLGQRLFPRSRFAQFASASGILNAVASLGMAPLVGLLIDRSGNLYRYTFAAALLFSTAALAAAWYAHGKFMKLGGPRNYVAP